jgi:drug/metabolite transporter (DMT)-like permease
MNRRLLFIGVLLACGIFWGSTQVLGKIAVSTGHQHFGLIFWQMAIGAVFLGVITLIQRKRVPLTRATLGFSVIIAVIGTIIPNSAFYYAVAHLPAGIMSIVISTVPLLSFPIALMLGMDRFSTARLAGLLCGLGGVALIALPQASLPEPGMAAFIPFALIGPLFYACESNVPDLGRGGAVDLAAGAGHRAIHQSPGQFWRARTGADCFVSCPCFGL